MKKIIKIFTLIIFIVLFFGITTSNAALPTVESTTPGRDMVQYLQASNSHYLTGISDQIRDQNPYLLCTEKNMWLHSSAKFTISKTTTYPGNGSDNGYARAYVLASSKYIKSDTSYGETNTQDEKQWAWYYFEGDTTEKNDLVTIAEAYQTYKTKEEKEVIINQSNAKSLASGNNVIYGPIKIQYSYKKAAGSSKWDEWGGFNYAFFDDNGTNISNKVKLCTLSNNTYTEITSTLSSSNDNTKGYYKVRTANYSNKDLYIVTTDKTLTNINLKLQDNKVSYTAIVYELEGQVYRDTSGTWSCTTCKYNITTSYTEAINDSNKIYEYNGKLYKYSETTRSSFNDTNRIDIYDYLYLGEELVVTDTRSTVVDTETYYSTASGGQTTSYNGAVTSYVNQCSYNSDRQQYYCNICGMSVTDATSHAKSTHVKTYTYYDYSRRNHYFTEYTGCRKVLSSSKDMKSRCGDTYDAGYTKSQSLLLIDTTSETSSTEIQEDFDVELLASIEVTKKWEDNENIYNKRPTDLELEVYRSTDGSKWTKLTKGTDYKISSWTKNGNTWTTTISELKRVDDSGKLYYFKVEEKSFSDYYEVKYQDGNTINGNVTDKKITIINELKYIDLTIYKVWDDFSNKYKYRPDQIEIKVYRSTNRQNWGNPLQVGTDYTLTWKKDGNTWVATISKIEIKDNSGNTYYFKAEEILDDKRYEITYSTNGAVIDTRSSTEFTITNKLRLVDISVTKEWEDFDNRREVRPGDIDLEVYRSINGQNWEGPLTEGKDYDEIVWTKNGDTWTATIKDLLEVDYNGNTYQYQVKEEDQTYYNVKYSSGNNKDGKVDNYTTKITNELKYIDIDLTKVWRNADDSNSDYNNEYNLRPDTIKLVVKRSTNNQNWETLTEGRDYEVEWTSKGSTDNTWTAKITKLLGVNSKGESYYFKVEESDKVLEYYDPVYAESIKYDNDKWQDVEFTKHQETLTLKNKLKKVDLSGYVWLDGQTGIKPAVPNNGIMDDSETKMANIVVHLMWVKPQALGGGTVEVNKTVTDEKGYYEFKDIEIGYYYVEFDYDGIHYEDTIKVENVDTEKVSKAFENDSERNTFNNRFKTITYKKSNDGTTLNYDYADKKSTLITTNQNGTVTSNFEMNATTDTELRKADTDNMNLGLVKRGTDVALSTDVYDAKVTINGQETTYEYNSTDNNIDIGTSQTSEEVSYNLNLYTSDYNYRIRNYISNEQFVEEDYINSEDPTGLQTGDELKVYVTYELNLQNQSTETTRINEVKYSYDEKYKFVGLEDSSYSVQNSGNVVTINLDALELKEGETKTIYLLFEVKETNNAVNLGEFSNKAEITSYSTDEGLIDIDSQPGNFIKDNQVEDDNDTAGGLTISVPNDLIRKITGKVFDEDGNNVNDVIVQLIELKTNPNNGKVYEYIWQETVAGTENGLRLNGTGDALENYTYSKTDGYYEFKGFIPGDYIVRFIYGDGTTYDMTDSVIKYNGQDYKSVIDSKYNAEWYNTASYNEGASVARDNEARRLETIAYSVEIDASKGVLLKLLNNLRADDLNKTEKEILIFTYNNLYGTSITVDDLTDDVISQLLKEQVLKNTWMCAETSKIKIAVDTQDAKNINAQTQVNGITGTYVDEISNINFGLELRPVTKMELKKYITSFKLTASNGQTLVNAYVDANEYLNGATDISNKVQGIRDNLTILGNVWQYEVNPTEINTVIDGANLEFQYVLVVENTGDADYLSEELANAYKNSSLADYKTLLATRTEEIKTAMRGGTYRTQIGKSVGNSYYIGGTGTGTVLTEITSIRDYVNTDLSPVWTGDVEMDQDALNDQTAGIRTYRMLDDAYALQTITLNTILKTTRETGKMIPNTRADMYTVTLSKNPVSATGNLEFDTYIAEVMSYTNAAGRRAIVSAPGNSEIVDAEKRDGKSHEIDEADTGRIQIGSATGNDIKTNYIIIIAVASGIALVALGAYVVKKYFMK